MKGFSSLWSFLLMRPNTALWSRKSKNRTYGKIFHTAGTISSLDEGKTRELL